MASKIERRMSKDLQEIPEIKSLKDCKTVDDFDFGKLDLIRGEAPENNTEKCLQLCKDYLSGIWRQQTVDTIEVKRISGGLTNQLYFCAISKQLKDCPDVPQEVAIRLYGPKYFNNTDNDGNERLTDVIIALMVSENQLGPKIYGLFESGQLQEFIKHRQFRLDEQNNPKLAAELYQKLARIHAMDVPIKRNTNWIHEYLTTSYEDAFKNFPINDMIKELNCETLMKYDLRKEIDWLMQTLIESKSPEVFCHNDFRGSNIMVTEGTNKITFCDFEYSCYGYRGFDLGTIIIEWGRTKSEFAKSEKLIQKFPNDSTIKSLISQYIKESEQIFGKKWSENKINSLEQILYETKLFSLATNMFITVFCLKNDEQAEGSFPIDKKVFIGLAEHGYESYWFLKDKFIKEGLFKQA